jgi:hypothetical protein
MYAHAAAVPFLDAVRDTFSAGKQACLLPDSVEQHGSSPLRLSAEHAAPLLAALPPNNPPRACLETARNSALARVDSLRQQRDALTRILAKRLSHPPSSPPSATAADATPVTTSVSFLSGPLSSLHSSNTTLSRAASTAISDAARTASALSGAISDLRRIELRLVEGTIFAASHAWNEVSTTLTPIDTKVGGDFEVGIIAQACRDAEEEHVHAQVGLARATAAYQSLRQYHGSVAISSASAGPTRGQSASMEQEVVRNRRAWESRLHDEVAPFAGARGYEAICARARMFDSVAAARRQAVRLAQSNAWLDIMSAQRARLALLFEVVRIGLEGVDNCCVDVEAFASEASGASCLSPSSKVNHDDALPLQPASPTKGVVTALATIPTLAAQVRELDVSIRNAESRAAQDCTQAAFDALLSFRQRVGCDNMRWLAVERSEIMSTGLRELQAKLQDAGVRLDTLIKKRSVKLETIGSGIPSSSSVTRTVWIDFFRPGGATRLEARRKDDVGLAEKSSSSSTMSQ